MNKKIILCFVALLIIGTPIIGAYAMKRENITYEYMEKIYNLLPEHRQKSIAIVACVDSRFMDKTPFECTVLYWTNQIPKETMIKYMLKERLDKKYPHEANIVEDEEEPEEIPGIY